MAGASCRSNRNSQSAATALVAGWSVNESAEGTPQGGGEHRSLTCDSVKNVPQKSLKSCVTTRNFGFFVEPV